LKKPSNFSEYKYLCKGKLLKQCYPYTPQGLSHGRSRYLKSKGKIMLVLGIKVRENVFIDNGKIKVTIIATQGSQVRLGFEAAKDISIDREVVHNAKKGVKE